jgi:hypothetical protein
LQLNSSIKNAIWYIIVPHARLQTIFSNVIQYMDIIAL